MAIAKKPTRAAASKTKAPSKPTKKAGGKPAPRRKIELTGAQKSYLRGLSHELKPVVQIGHAGLTEGVVRQIDEALETHELIKVKLAKEAPLEPAEAGEPLEKQLTANVAQRIGRILVLYRPRAKEPTIKLPR